MPVPRPDTLELAYTSKKIQANFSNFSAWHQRSKVLPKLWDSGALDEAKSREEGTQPHIVVPLPSPAVPVE
jgi:geranylgeranyl transferase type-2 subunit alpha